MKLQMSRLRCLGLQSITIKPKFEHRTLITNSNKSQSKGFLWHLIPTHIKYIIHEGYNKTQPKKPKKRERKIREMKKDLPSERKTDSRSLILTLLGRSSDCSPKSAALLLSPTIDYQNKQQNINWKYHNCNQKAPKGDKVSTFDSDLGSETDRPESISSPISFFEKI